MDMFLLSAYYMPSIPERNVFSPVASRKALMIKSTEVLSKLVQVTAEC